MVVNTGSSSHGKKQGKHPAFPFGHGAAPPPAICSFKKLPEGFAPRPAGSFPAPGNFSGSIPAPPGSGWCNPPGAPAPPGPPGPGTAPLPGGCRW